MVHVGLAVWFFLFEGIGGMLVGFFFLLNASFALLSGVSTEIFPLAGWLHILRGILFCLAGLKLAHQPNGVMLTLSLALAVEAIASFFWLDSILFWLPRILYLPFLHYVVLRPTE